MVSEAERKAIFNANPMVEGFLSTALQDLQLSESEEGGTRDSGTIYDCPDATFRAAVAECEGFAAGASAEQIPGCDFTVAEFIRDSFRHVQEHIGSDLYLERAGHGAGFQDRDIWSDDRDENRAIGEALSAAVNPRSTLETYIGDDGQAWFVGKES